MLVNERTLVFALMQDEGLDQQRKVVADCRARGAKVVAYGASNLRAEDADVVHPRPSPEPFSNAVAAISVHVSGAAGVRFQGRRARGIDPDNPEGLTAWVVKL